MPPGRVQTSHAAASGDLVKQQNPQGPPIELGDDGHLARRPLRGGGKHELGTPAVANKPQASQDRLGARASKSINRDTAHLRKVQAIAWPQTRLKRGRGRFIREGTPHIGDEAVIVGVKAEGSKRLNQAMKIGG